MRRFALLVSLTALVPVALASSAAAKKPAPGPGYTLVGTARLVSPGDQSATAVEMSTDGSSGSTTSSGAIGYAVAPGLKLGAVNTLSSDYQFVAGSCAGGSPRFTVGVAKGPTTREIYFYFGRQPNGSFVCPSGSYGNTGNLASQSSLVDTSQLPGGSYSDTYASAQAKYGGYAVKYIAIDLDGGFAGAQTADFDSTQVDGVLYTYEP